MVHKDGPTCLVAISTVWDRIMICQCLHKYAQNEIIPTEMSGLLVEYGHGSIN